MHTHRAFVLTYAHTHARTHAHIHRLHAGTYANTHTHTHAHASTLTDAPAHINICCVLVALCSTAATQHHCSLCFFIFLICLQIQHGQNYIHCYETFTPRNAVFFLSDNGGIHNSNTSRARGVSLYQFIEA